MILPERVTTMKKNKLTLILSVVSLIATIIIYERLPDMIPMHFNFQGQVDRYDHKYMIFILSGIPLVIALLKVILPKIDPKRENYKKHASAYNKLMFFLTLFLICTNWAVIAVSMGVNLKIHVIIPIGVGILLIIVGNYMPQYRHNYFVGIKTPWTLTDEDNWKRIHYIGGYVFILDGIIVILTSFIRSEIALVSVMAVVLLSVAFLYYYSYQLYAKKHKK